MRRVLALTALAAVAALAAPAHAAYTCEPNPATSNVGVCVQVTQCQDVCVLKPGAYVYCDLGFGGERVCRIVRALGVETGG
jgi:hypothetical protein